MESTQSPSLDTLKDIRNMMERSSRFISLSGWSGVAAGICALVGAFLASRQFAFLREGTLDLRLGLGELKMRLALLSLGVFVAALASATFFTWLRTRREKVSMWGGATKRLFWSIAVPMLAGGVFGLRLIYLDIAGLLAPVCLLFYGLALVNGSKYTLGEIRYLGYSLIILGAINTWVPGYGLYFWAAGFGVFHIIYGIWMWRKYEANQGK